MQRRDSISCKIEFLSSEQKQTAGLELDTKMFLNYHKTEEHESRDQANVKLKNIFKKKKPKRRRGGGGKKGVDNFANACQSVCSTWPPSTTLSFIHTLPVKTDSFYNGHMSNSSLTAAREDTVCICQEMNKHLQLSQQQKCSKNTVNGDTSVT